MAITLVSEALEVLITPERGGDIVQVTDRASGVPTLAVSPTGGVTAPRLPSADSMVLWTNGYPGGWQFLVPNAGPERIHDGVVQGYHGEASLAEWRIVEHRSSTATLTTSLLTAPLQLTRVLTLEGGELTVTDTITNTSPEIASARLAQHPAFGTPFLDEGSYVVVRAGTLITDASTPGTLTPADAVGPPTELLPAGPVADSIALPAPHSGEALFGALSDFPDGHASATFCSPTHGFGMRLGWDRSVYPHAWLWMEANSGSGFPWYKRLYSMAVEPANVLPGEGTSPGGHERGGIGVLINGGDSLVSRVTLSRVSLNDAAPGGNETA